MKVKDTVYIIFIMITTWIFAISLGKTFSYIDYEKDLYQERINTCKKETDNIIIVSDDNMSDCERILLMDENEYTFYDVYNIFVENFNGLNGVILIQVVMVISLILEILSKLKYHYPSYYLVRKSYKSFIFSILKSILKVIIVIPVAISISYLLIGIYSNFNFSNSSEYIDMFFTNSGNATLLILNVLNTIILFGVYANICLIVCRAERRSILSILITFLYFIMIELFLVVVIDNLFIDKVLDIKNFVICFNIFATFYYENNSFIYKEILSSLLYFTLSMIPVILVYFNKEKLVMDTSSK